MSSSDYRRRREATVEDINVALSEWQMKVINQRVQPARAQFHKLEATQKGKSE